MGEIEWNVGWKNGKSGVGWMPDDAINDRGERRNYTLSGGRGEAEFGMRNAECGMRNQGRRGSTAYRRAQGSAAFRVWRTLIQKRDICGAAAAPAPVYGGRGQ